MKVSREAFLQQLEAVRPGLSVREMAEQSNCFIFRKGSVTTFNDEMACTQKTMVQETCAVRAEPLLELLRRLPEEEIDITISKSEFLVQGKHRKAGITMEREIVLPIDSIQIPDKWATLPEVFPEAVDTVAQCASRDESTRGLVYCYLHPKYLQACDNMQMARYEMKTPIKKPCLVRADSLKQMIPLGMIKIAFTSSWIHFKNKGGLVMSCRRNEEFAEDYPELGTYLNAKGGVKTELPKGLLDAVEKAEVFSAENTDNNHVKLELKKGKVRISSESTSGWYQEIKTMRYKGESMSFLISPSMLISIMKRNNVCEILDSLLRIKTTGFTYVTSLVQEQETT